jgi:stage II sporulation protein AA (anti-sigma F factor antagonist)
MEYQVEEDFLTIFLPQELDHHQAEALRYQADAIIEKRRIRHIILDFANTVFMDSSGIGTIMGRYRLISLLGGEMWAVNTNDRIRKILKMSGVTRILQIYEEDLQDGEHE